MTSNSRQIEFLARAIVNRLEDRGLVEFGDAEQGIRLVARVLEENFAAVEAIEQQARQTLARSLRREPKPSEIEVEMQRVATERDFTL